MSIAYSAIRTRVHALVANSAMITDSNIATLVQSDHLEILNGFSWSRRKADTVVNTVAEVTTGTVSSSGTTVTGVGTSFTASMVGSFIRIGSNTFFHEITAVAGGTSLTIEAALPTNAAAGSSYRIFRHVYDMPSDFGRAVTITGDVRLKEWSRSDIDRIDPYRISTATRPDAYSIRGLTTSPGGVYQIEFWPVPSSAQMIRIEYLRTNTLSADSDEPLYPGEVLVWKSAESAAFFLHGRSGDAAWLALADRFRTRYDTALQAAKDDDLQRFSSPTYVRDRAWDLGTGRGDDFWNTHDWLNLR